MLRSLNWNGRPASSLRAALIAAAVACSMIAYPGEVEAELLGDVLRPFASVAEIYDSNVFRVRDRGQLQGLMGDNQLADRITAATIGTRVHYELRQQLCDLLLKRDFIRFSHYPSQDVDQDELAGTVASILFDRLVINGKGNYLKVPQSRADFRSAGINIVTSTNGGVTAAYTMPSGAGLEIGYSRSSVDYSLPQLKAIQYSVDHYAAVVSYSHPTVWRLFASYERNSLRYDGDSAAENDGISNNVADSAGIGVERKIAAKTLVSCYVGYLNRRHNNASARDFTGLVGKAAVDYNLTAKVGLRLNWERQLNEETYANRIYSLNDMVGAGLSYRISEKVTTTVFERLWWKSFRDLPGSGAVPRTDFVQDMTVGVEWRMIKGMAASLEYRYTDRSSDDSTFNFADHTIGGKVLYSF